MDLPGSSTALSVRPITAEEHLDFINAQPSASFLQTPAWGLVKSEWRHESLGWFRDNALVGAGLVLYRQLPRVKRYLAYLPEGPVIDWSTGTLLDWLDPMAAYLKAQGAFGVRMGPPVRVRHWTADQVKDGIADETVSRLQDVAGSERDPIGESVVRQLAALGWRAQVVEGGFAAGQPQYVFQLPLAGRTEEDVLGGMNQQWRRNIKKADKAGVKVTEAELSSDGAFTDEDVRGFHELYVRTAERDGFTPRPLAYFQRMFEAMRAEDPDRIRLFLARHEGDLVAATIMVSVGSHVWYAYGASSTEKRDVRGSNAIQWAMMRSAMDAGADVYDMRGITSTLDAEDSHVGLIQFKVGTGGQAVEYAGEWDLPLNPLLYRAFALYMRRR